MQAWNLIWMQLSEVHIDVKSGPAWHAIDSVGLMQDVILCDSVYNYVDHLLGLEI